jgi:Leucine-rich repeat (LRR) protein
MEIALERIANMRDGVLDLSNLGLTELPPLPPTLVELDCRGNQLTELPQLVSEDPSTLKYLYCEGNQLTSLPQLPSTLRHLNCHSNQLTSLPQLPSTLSELHCSYNQLTSLPQLPSTLNYLDYGYNPIQYPPADVMEGSFADIRDWMSENPLTFVKSANKV